MVICGVHELEKSNRSVKFGFCLFVSMIELNVSKHSDGLLSLVFSQSH